MKKLVLVTFTVFFVTNTFASPLSNDHEEESNDSIEAQCPTIEKGEAYKQTIHWPLKTDPCFF